MTSHFPESCARGQLHYHFFGLQGQRHFPSTIARNVSICYSVSIHEVNPSFSTSKMLLYSPHL